MSRSRYASKIQPPKTPDGNLYYVRLNTPQGVFYKLGFTKLGSVSDRLAFQRTGDERMIDKVILFTHRPDAYTVESQLHNHFSKQRVFGSYGNAKDRPLAGNGQSELYIEDILGLDKDFSRKKADQAKRNIKRPFSGDIIGGIVMGGAAIFLLACITPLILLFQWTIGRKERLEEIAQKKRDKQEIEDLIDQLKWRSLLKEAATRDKA